MQCYQSQTSLLNAVLFAHHHQQQQQLALGSRLSSASAACFNPYANGTGLLF